jgi:DNA end-binding protein Ku
MPRSIWTGAISFGLVTVPVRVYSAVSRKTVRFNQLNATTGNRIAQKRVDAVTGDEVAYEDLVKGYEIAPDRYVLVSPDELEALDPAKTRTIEIDPIFYDHPYYLAPGPGGAKPYRLLLDAMAATGKVGIARVVIRQKEALVALRPMGDVLGMATMLFADEVVDPGRLDDVPSAADVQTTERELKIAKQLVETLAGPFDPAKYRDEHREAVLALVERKAAGEEVQIAEAPAAAAPAPDLMAALKASLDAVRAEKAPAQKGAKPRARAPRRRTPVETG